MAALFREICSQRIAAVATESHRFNAQPIAFCSTPAPSEMVTSLMAYALAYRFIASVRKHQRNAWPLYLVDPITEAGEPGQLSEVALR